MRNLVIILFTTTIYFNCSQNNMPEEFVLNDSLKYNFKILEKSRIFFGHQSVGYNILDGINDLLREAKNNNINIIELREDLDLPKYYFLHSTVGRNRDPQKKCDDFLNILNKDSLRDINIAMLKFCYADIQGDSDVHAIFEYYKDMVDSIQKKNPGLKLIHSTVPISTLQTGWKAVIKKLMNKEIDGYRANIKRYQFNEMLKQFYNGEPIFDIAKIESTYPDGSREGYSYNGTMIFSMVEEYTTDGGHLNEIGRKLVAAELLRVLTNMAD